MPHSSASRGPINRESVSWSVSENVSRSSIRGDSAIGGASTCKLRGCAATGAAIDKHVASEKIGFRIVFDELVGDTFLVADPYGVAGTPALFIIDKKGAVSFTALGFVAAPQLKNEIDKVVK